MAVIFGCKAKMSLIFRLVFGTFHRAQGKPAQKRLFFRPLDTFHQFLNFPWMHFLLSHFQDMGKTVCQGCQFPDFFQIRIFMGTVQKRKFFPKTVFRNHFICRKHKFLDDLGCKIAVIWHDIDRMPFVIKNQFTLRKIKVDRALFFSLCP